MLQKLKENKQYIYLAVGIIAGIALTWAYNKYFKSND
jgi:hypothetical protein